MSTESHASTTDPEKVDHLLTNAQYDLLKKIVQLGLPAFGTLYAGLAKIWGFPNGEAVVGSIALITVFGGVILGFSSRSYSNSVSKLDGALVVDTTDAMKDVYRFELKQPLQELTPGQELTIKVQPPT